MTLEERVEALEKEVTAMKEATQDQAAMTYEEQLNEKLDLIISLLPSLEFS